MKYFKTGLYLLILCVLLLFSGCGTPFEPVTFVSGNLDLIYHDTVSEEFAASIGEKEAAAAQEIRSNYINQTVMEIFTAYNRAEPPAELQKKLEDSINLLYKAAKYEVGAAEETENGYTVMVTVYPLLTYQTVTESKESIDAVAAACQEQYTAGLSTEEITDTSLNIFCDTLINALKEPTYGEKTELTLEVTKDEDGYYIINGEDLTHLEQIMLYNSLK